MGIEAIDPFELPLLNTVILLSSGATITYAHHSLIQGGRTGALYGSVATVLLAIIFTGLTHHPRILFGIAGLIRRSRSAIETSLNNSYSSFNISSCMVTKKNTYSFCSSLIGSFNNRSFAPLRLRRNSNRSYTTTTVGSNIKDSGLSPF